MLTGARNLDRKVLAMPDVLPWPPTTLEDKLAAIDMATAMCRYPGELVASIHAVFQTNPTRFWQQVNAMLTDLDVIAARPIQCRQLRERRTGWRQRLQ